MRHAPPEKYLQKIALKKLEYNNVYEDNRPGSHISASYNILDIIDKGAFMLANAPHAEGWSNSVEYVINNILDL